MTEPATNEEGLGNPGDEGTLCRSSGPIVLAVLGNPVVGRALALLLRGPGYDARFLPALSSSVPGSLESVRLLLLTPTPELSTERRKAFLASIRDVPGLLEMPPVLELVGPSEQVWEGGARDGSWYATSWPCSIEELKRSIETALLANPRADPTACLDPRARGEKKEDGA